MRTILNARRAHWAVPVAMVATAGAIAGGVALAGESSPELPAKDAAQLMTDLQGADLEPFSGTVVQTSRLGLPELPGVTDDSTDVSLLRMLTGSNTARLWYSSAEQFRFSLMGAFDEITVIRDATDVWLWSSDSNTAEHLELPANLPMPGDGTPRPDPHVAAQKLLDQVDPTTEVIVTGTVDVAGRAAYELAIRPRDDGSLIDEIAVAIDGETSRVLRVEVMAPDLAEPAFEIGFTSISFDEPSDEVYRFNPPPGAEVTEHTVADLMGMFTELGSTPAFEPTGPPQVIGDGWTSVVVVPDVVVPDDAGQDGQAIASAILRAGQEVDGPYGSGRLFTTSLLSALWLDDGTLLIGAVTPDVLEDAATDVAQ